MLTHDASHATSKTYKELAWPKKRVSIICILLLKCLSYDFIPMELSFSHEFNNSNLYDTNCLNESRIESSQSMTTTNIRIVLGSSQSLIDLTF